MARRREHFPDESGGTDSDPDWFLPKNPSVLCKGAHQGLCICMRTDYYRQDGCHENGDDNCNPVASCFA